LAFVQLSNETGLFAAMRNQRNFAPAAEATNVAWEQIAVSLQCYDTPHSSLAQSTAELSGWQRRLPRRVMSRDDRLTA
jgi:hypothetical protein